MFARLVFAAVQFRARRGLAELPPEPPSPQAQPLAPASASATSAVTPSPARLGAPNSKFDPDAEGETLPLFAPLPNPQAAAAFEKKQRARRTGIRGETYAYWFLRAQGYVMVARNFMTPGVKGEIDIVGYDGPTLAFIEVKTRSMSADSHTNAPELAVDEEKHQLVSRLAARFSAARRVDLNHCRFDVVAIETRPGRPPVIRLHKGVDTGNRQLPLRTRF
jgi:putative endonuclease